MRWPANTRALRALMRDPMGLMGLILVALFILMALAAPILAPYNPLALDVRAKLQSPALHW